MLFPALLALAGIGIAVGLWEKEKKGVTKGVKELPPEVVAIVPMSPEESAKVTSYTVLPGDTLTTIAIKLALAPKPVNNLRSSWEPAIQAGLKLAVVNGIANADDIKTGQVLKVG